jgi:hypothetical protein
MLTFDPKQRITAKDALLESYFVSAEPSPLSPEYVLNTRILESRIDTLLTVYLLWKGNGMNWKLNV